MKHAIGEKLAARPSAIISAGARSVLEVDERVLANLIAQQSAAR